MPAADNSEKIAAYNGFQLAHKGKKPQEDKLTQMFLSIWGIENSSILSDNNVELGFEVVQDKDGTYNGYKIRVTNKTNSPIYIDLASSYRVMNGDFAEPYFTNSVYNEGAGNSRGGSVNLGAVAGALGIGGALGNLAGGINLGGGNTQTSGITTQEQQILTVPPHSSVTMPGRKVSTGKNILECLEQFYFYNRTATNWNYYLKSEYIPFLSLAHDITHQTKPDDTSVTRDNFGVARWVQKNLSPTESPKHMQRMITYSTSPNFETYTTLPINLYMSGAYGIYTGAWGVNTLFNPNDYELNKQGLPLVGMGYIGKKK